MRFKIPNEMHKPSKIEKDKKKAKQKQEAKQRINEIRQRLLNRNITSNDNLLDK